MDDATAGAVHDHHTGFHGSDGLRVDDALRFRRQRRMDRNDVGALKQIRQRHHRHAHFLCSIRSQIGIVRDHSHTDSLRHFRQVAADLADTDDAEHLIIELDPHELVLLPLARFHRRGGLRNPAAHRADHGHRVLGGRNRIAARRIHHDDAAFGGRRRIDVIEAGARAPHDFQLRSGRDQLLRHLGAGPHDQPIGVLNLLKQFFFRHF